jgi:spermidine synthase
VTSVLCAIFLVSGAASLTFEALWFYQAGLALGNSVWASSLVLAGFMCGIGAGNALAARYGDRISNPVRAYAILEVAIAVAGVALVYVLPNLTPLLAPVLIPLEDTLWLLNLVRLLMGFLLLLAPSTAMGMTLPVLTRGLTNVESNFGRSLGRLYGWNTFGATAGVIAAEVLLVERIGIRGSALAAGALCLTAASSAAAISRRFAPPPATPPPSGPWRLREGAPWLISAFLTGFALLGLEVVWFRFLSLFTQTDAESFAFMLAIVLAGIATGGALASLWLRRVVDAHRYALPVVISGGIVCIASYAAFPVYSAFLGAGRVYSFAETAAIGIPLMFPVSALSGISFTLLGAGLREDLPTAASTTGLLTFANTLGASLGAIAGGFVLLPVLGMERSFFCLALAYPAAAAVLLIPGERSWSGAGIGGLLFAVAACLFPFGAMESQHFRRVLVYFGDPPAEQVWVREGISETILYVEDRRMGKPYLYRLVTNGLSMSATGVEALRYMKLYLYWPAAVHPDLESALLISYGVGSTAKSLTDHRNLETIDIVDISKDILEMSEIVYPDDSELPLNDPRVTVHVEDGRYFLETTSKRFDLITGEPPPPDVAGVAGLYTREHFERIYDRLNEGGIVTYWLPLHSLTDASALGIIHAFCDAFPDCSLWHGMKTSLMLVGTRNAHGGTSLEDFTRQWRDDEVAPELKRLGFERPEQLGALYIGGSDYLRELSGATPPVVDDFPKRITASTTSPDAERELFAGWRDATAARERFARDPLIEALWPASLRRETLDYFEYQQMINDVVEVATLDWTERLDRLKRLLQDTTLVAPVQWLLASNDDYVRIVEALPAHQRGSSEAQYRLGIGRLSERRYGAAAAAFAKAQASPQLYAPAGVLRVFAMCMDGRTDEAAEAAEVLYAAVGVGGHTASFWRWLNANFGIDTVGGPERARSANPARWRRGGHRSSPDGLGCCLALQRSSPSPSGGSMSS